MSQSIETLTQVLNDVAANRKNLAEQLDTQRQQIEVGEAQLIKFDTLIAALQVAVSAPNVMELIEQQEAANAIVSPTGAAGIPDAAAGNAANESAQAAG
jgi:hypothetical protein